VQFSERKKVSLCLLAVAAVNTMLWKRRRLRCGHRGLSL